MKSRKQPKKLILKNLTSCTFYKISYLKTAYVNPKKLEENVQLQLANDLASFQQKLDLNSRSWIDKCRTSEYENKNLRQQVAELESELVGARLDAKYLDKELAG